MGRILWRAAGLRGRLQRTACAHPGCTIGSRLADAHAERRTSARSLNALGATTEAGVDNTRPVQRLHQVRARAHERTELRHARSL